MLQNTLLTVTQGVATEGMKLGFTTENVSEALAMMGKGMLGIFVALFAIYLACIALKKIFPPKADEQ